MKLQILILFFIIVCKFGISQNIKLDTTIGGISLQNSNSVAFSAYNDKIWNKLFEDSDELIKSVLLNFNKTQKVELIAHYGCNKNEFLEVVISNVQKNNKLYNDTNKYIITDVFEFKTGENIKLGVSSNYVRKKLNITFLEKKKGNNLILSFRKNITNLPMFKRYNMPIYYGRYYFNNDKLIKFSFGFEPQ
ncbi:MAG: hypothetical protein WCO13_05405 [Bacteroidota bacterium]